MGHMMTESFAIRPLTPTIGAEVFGVDLSQALPPSTIAAIHAAWMEHLVLFFHDQPLSEAQLQALGRQFGEPHIHPHDRGDVKWVLSGCWAYDKLFSARLSIVVH
jgi:taurine dioxygenase